MGSGNVTKCTEQHTKNPRQKATFFALQIAPNQVDCYGLILPACLIIRMHWKSQCGCMSLNSIQTYARQQQKKVLCIISGILEFPGKRVFEL